VNQTRIILHVNEGSDGILALRAARRLMADGHRSCIYSYENGVSIYAYHTQTGVAAREHIGAAQ
jgi:hypothetical protein